MNIQLSPIEARVIGCLIEKQITTPDQYPLSLNALVNACNQKSNRDPVMSADDAEIQTTLDQLIRKHFVVEKSGFGSRDSRYAHLFSGAVSIPTLPEESTAGASMDSAPVSSRLERLEEEVRQLKEELKDIKARLPPQ